MDNHATRTDAGTGHAGHWYRINHDETVAPTPRTIQALQNEHAYMFSLLDSLEEQVKLITRGQEADFSLLRDIVDYMQNFPERYHHPKEDLIYQRMALRDDLFARQVSGLMEEHKVLEQLMTRLSHAIEDVHTLATVLKKKRVGEICAEYETRMRAHINNEETNVLPRAVDVLLEEDWFLIDQQSTPINEIPIDNILTDNYTALRRLLKGKTEKLANNVVLAEFLGSHGALEFMGGVGANLAYGREAYTEGVKQGWSAYVHACKSWLPGAGNTAGAKFQNPVGQSLDAFIAGLAGVNRPEAEVLAPVKRAMGLYSLLVGGRGKAAEQGANAQDEVEFDLISMQFPEDISRLVQ